MKSDLNIWALTKGAFTQARANLNPWAFKRLNEVAVDSFYDGKEYLYSIKFTYLPLIKPT
jgi:hypothetical protein